MTNQYGPWATLIDAGGNPQLSAFWRRRLMMLVPASQTSPVLSRRNLLWLGAAAVLILVLPTFRSVPAAAEDEMQLDNGRIAAKSAPPEAKEPRKRSALPEAERGIPYFPNIGKWDLPYGTGGRVIAYGDGGVFPSGSGVSEEIKRLIAEQKYMLGNSTISVPRGAMLEPLFKTYRGTTTVKSPGEK